MVGWAVDLPALSLGARGIACRGGASNAFLDATHDELAAELRAVRAWDRGGFTLSGGALVGGALLIQHFTGTAPSRESAAGLAGLTAAASYDLAPRTYVTAELDGVTAFFRQEDMAETGWRAAFTLRANLLVGARW